MSEPQNSPEDILNENPPKNRVPPTQQVTILLTLDISTNLGTSLWPGHIVLEDSQAAFIWRFLEETVLSGKAVSGSDSHILAFDIPDEDQVHTGLPLKARLGEGAIQYLIPFLQHCYRTFPIELHALNNLEYAMQGASCVSLYDREGYSWGVQTWRHGRQIWNKWVGDRLVGSWEPDGRLPREQVLEWYRKWNLNLRSEDWREGC